MYTSMFHYSGSLALATSYYALCMAGKQFNI